MNDDLISRQVAIDAVIAEFDECLVWDESGEVTADEVARILDELPSVQTERKKGKWIYDGKRGRFPVCKCSVCGNYENADWAIIQQAANYCPNCGADMRGEQE